MKEIEGEISEAKDKIKRFDLSLQAAKTKVRELAEKYKWINNEKEFFGVAGTNYHFEKVNINKFKQEVKQLDEENEHLKKRINRNVE